MWCQKCGREMAKANVGQMCPCGGKAGNDKPEAAPTGPNFKVMKKSNVPSSSHQPGTILQLATAHPRSVAAGKIVILQPGAKDALQQPSPLMSSSSHLASSSPLIINNSHNNNSTTTTSSPQPNTSQAQTPSFVPSLPSTPESKQVVGKISGFASSCAALDKGKATSICKILEDSMLLHQPLQDHMTSVLGKRKINQRVKNDKTFKMEDKEVELEVKVVFSNKAHSASFDIATMTITLPITPDAEDIVDAFIFESCNVDLQPILGKMKTEFREKFFSDEAQGDEEPPCLAYGKAYASTENEMTTLKQAQFAFDIKKAGGKTAAQGEKNILAVEAKCPGFFSMSAQEQEAHKPDLLSMLCQTTHDMTSANKLKLELLPQPCSQDIQACSNVFEIYDLLDAGEKEKNQQFLTAAMQNPTALTSQECYAFEGLTAFSNNKLATLVCQKINDAAKGGVTSQQITGDVKTAIGNSLTSYTGNGMAAALILIIDIVPTWFPTLNIDFSCFEVTPTMKRLAQALHPNFSLKQPTNLLNKA